MNKKLLCILLSTGLIMTGCQSSDEGTSNSNIEDVVKNRLENTEKVKKELENLDVDLGTESEVDESEVDKNEVELDESPKDNLESSTNVDSYDYTDYVDASKAEFYKTNEIFLGTEKNQEEDMYLIYFYSPLCIYCDKFIPTLQAYESMENSYPIYKLNLHREENVSGWDSYKIKGTPTLILFNKKEQKVESTIIGLTSLDMFPLKTSAQ